VFRGSRCFSLFFRKFIVNRSSSSAEIQGFRYLDNRKKQLKPSSFPLFQVFFVQMI